MLRLALTVQSPDGSFAGVTVEQGSAIIGADARADLRLQTPGVAGIHAIVRQAAGVVTLVNVGGEILRHGQHLPAETTLLDGETFVIDGHAITVNFRSEAPAQDVAPTLATAPGSAEPTLVTAAPTIDLAPHPLVDPDLRADDRPAPHDRLLEVAALWQGDLIDIGHVRPPTVATAGASAPCTVHVPLPSLDAGPLVLARATPTGYVAAGAAGREIGLTERVVITRGALQFVLRYVATRPPRRVRRSRALDFRFAAVLACSLIAHSLFAWSVQITPRHHHRHDLDDNLLASALKTVRTHVQAVVGTAPRPAPRPPRGGQQGKAPRLTPTFSIREKKAPPAKLDKPAAVAALAPAKARPDRTKKKPLPSEPESAVPDPAVAEPGTGDPALPPGPPGPATQPQPPTPTKPDGKEVAVASVELTINAGGARSCGFAGPGAPVTTAADAKTGTLAWPSSLLAPLRTRPPADAYLGNLRVLGRIGPRALGSYRVALPNDVIRVDLDEPSGAALYVGRTDARCVIVATITGDPLRLTLRGVPLRLMDGKRAVSSAIVDVVMDGDARFEIRLREGEPLLFQRGRLANGSAVAATLQAHLKLAQSIRGR